MSRVLQSNRIRGDCKQHMSSLCFHVWLTNVHFGLSAKIKTQFDLKFNHIVTMEEVSIASIETDGVIKRHVNDLGKTKDILR